ncbi:PREDICTED: thioredoxin domain-containing protein 3 homolog [Priapulus caudatus]|uniref:Thioredoxin domain-containing protein 3 homolog n=1 Tax=Priapulus caudatus TaxID=37621 RepID=A0ABM1DNY6_PRICU|nr:PREDICTED: thioredoxin domain-containing protein 3 homolog [Priapulus caudatus]
MKHRKNGRGECLRTRTQQLWDVYHQKWCGPCKALESIFKKVKLETGSDLLNFAVAKADTVDALESYQGRCETCLLFYAGGKLVNVMRGVNAPLLVRTLVSELNKETTSHCRRREKEIAQPCIHSMAPVKIVDTGATMNTSVNLDETMEEEQDSQKEAEKSVPEDQQKKEVTLAIIKPDVINDGKLQDILDEIAAAGIKILETQRKILSEEEVNLLYPSLQNEEYFDDIVKYLMSGDSQIMVLCKMGTEKGIVDVWQNMIGPMDSSIAKEEACDSLRAKYGTDKITNGLHGSDSIASANREVACFFPDFDRYSSDKPADESATHPDKKTLAVIRPDALEEYKDAILARITEAGFEVTDQKEMHLSTEQAEKFYKCHQEAPFYGELVNLMSSGPSLFLLLTKDDAVNEWRELIGPTDPATAKLEAPESLRALYGQDTVKNAVHGCSCDDEATDHIDQIFGDELATGKVLKEMAPPVKEELVIRRKNGVLHQSQQSNQPKMKKDLLKKQNSNLNKNHLLQKTSMKSVAQMSKLLHTKSGKATLKEVNKVKQGMTAQKKSAPRHERQPAANMQPTSSNTSKAATVKDEQ